MLDSAIAHTSHVMVLNSLDYNLGGQNLDILLMVCLCLIPPALMLGLSFDPLLGRL